MKYKINKNLILQKMDNSLVGFDSEKSFLYTFNTTAEYIFRKIKLGWEKDKILSGMSKKYAVSLPILEKDFDTTINTMLKNKIIYSTLSK